MGWSKSHISLKFKWYMSFTRPQFSPIFFYQCPSPSLKYWIFCCFSCQDWKRKLNLTFPLIFQECSLLLFMIMVQFYLLFQEYYTAPCTIPVSAVTTVRFHWDVLIEEGLIQMGRQRSSLLIRDKLKCLTNHLACSKADLKNSFWENIHFGGVWFGVVLTGWSLISHFFKASISSSSRYAIYPFVQIIS